jgi:uncharacterized OB-fold protein
MQSFGCEKCGRDGQHLQPVAFSGRGTVIAKAVVHIHADPRRSVPFAVGVVQLDEGPQIKALLAEPISDAPEPGDTVVARSFIIESPEKRTDVRFVRVQG